MGVVKAEALYSELERDSLGGTFFVTGDDEYLKEDSVQKLIGLHIDPATRDFNLDQLRGQGLDPETLASVCQTPPMLSDWRVVVVRDAQALASNARLRSVVDTLNDRHIPGLALIFATSGGDHSKAKFFKRLEKNSRTVVLNALPSADVPGWLMDRAAAEGVEIEPAAARALASAIGSGLGVLGQELDKLIEFVGERRKIRPGDVEQMVGVQLRQNRWEWFDLVGDGRFADARAGLPILLEASETGVGLLVGLGTQLLRIGIIVAGGERRLQDLLPPHQKWLASRLKRQARKWTAPRVDAALEDLLRADRLLKSASLKDLHIMNELLLRMQQRRAAA